MVRQTVRGGRAHQPGPTSRSSAVHPQTLGGDEHEPVFGLRWEAPQVDPKVLAWDCVVRSGQPSRSGSEEVHRRRFTRATVAVLVEPTALRHKSVAVRLARDKSVGSKSEGIFPKPRITVGGEEVDDHPIASRETNALPFQITRGGPADHGEKRRSAAHFLGKGRP